jgi:hypothetical protein
MRHFSAAEKLPLKIEGLSYEVSFERSTAITTKNSPVQIILL